MGRPLMPHQRLVVDVFLEVQSVEAGDPEPGEWAYNDGTVTGPRRIGKTAIQAPIVIHRARMIERAQMFMTAQKREKARRRFLDLAADIRRTPLRSDVKLKTSIGHEELLWLVGDSSLIPFAPGDDEMHSETPDLVLIDELWAFDAEQRRKIQAGYVPAFGTTGGQALKQSTAGTDRSDWLNDERKSGRASVESGVNLGRCYFEWSLPDRIGGVRLKDLEVAELIEACIDHHPAVCHTPDCPGPRARKPCPHGFTVRASGIRSAWDDLDDRAEFTRAYGNRSSNDLAALWTALVEKTWHDQADPVGIPADAPVGFGVWVDEDGLDAAVSAGWRDASGHMHVEPLQRREGTKWVRGFLDGLSTKPRLVAVANVGPARDVADELTAAGHPVLPVSQADVAAAVARHRQELGAGTWWHRVNTDATASAAAVSLRNGRWDRSGDSVAFVGAESLAGWSWDHAPAPVSTVFGMG